MKTFKVKFADPTAEDLVVQAESVFWVPGSDYQFQVKKTGVRDEYVTVAWVDADRVLFIQEVGSDESA